LVAVRETSLLRVINLTTARLYRVFRVRAYCGVGRTVEMSLTTLFELAVPTQMYVQLIINWPLSKLSS